MDDLILILTNEVSEITQIEFDKKEELQVLFHFIDNERDEFVLFYWKFLLFSDVEIIQSWFYNLFDLSSDNFLSFGMKVVNALYLECQDDAKQIINVHKYFRYLLSAFSQQQIHHGNARHYVHRCHHILLNIATTYQESNDSSLTKTKFIQGIRNLSLNILISNKENELATLSFYRSLILWNLSENQEQAINKMKSKNNIFIFCSEEYLFKNHKNENMSEKINLILQNLLTNTFQELVNLVNIDNTSNNHHEGNSPLKCYINRLHDLVSLDQFLESVTEVLIYRETKAKYRMIALTFITNLITNHNPDENSLHSKALVVLSDICMLDSSKEVRLKAISLVSNWPAHLVSKDLYRVLLLKCRDKCPKISSAAFQHVVSLGTGVMRRLLGERDFVHTVVYLWKIAALLHVDIKSGAAARFLETAVLLCVSSPQLGEQTVCSVSADPPAPVEAVRRLLTDWDGEPHLIHCLESRCFQRIREIVLDHCATNRPGRSAAEAEA